MAFDPSALPLLLAGPVLRRVESDLVCVWVATSRPCDVSIYLFPGADVVAPAAATDDPRAQWVSLPQPTVAIGAHIHIVAATLDMRVPGGNASRSNGQLPANQDFSYDIQLLARGAAIPQNLRTLGLLNAPVPLGYDPNELPGFRTSPDERDKLVIVHGSCRRMFNEPPLMDDPARDGPFPPPGGWPPEEPTSSDPVLGAPDDFPDDAYPRVPKRDGFLWVDALIDPRGPVPHIANRPHQLFLTGDQIYADDVPAVLLPALNYVGRILMGDEELATTALGSPRAVADLQKFPPAFRRDIVLRSGGLSTSDGESHLLTFGEFIAYYILTWSPALWALDLWPPQAFFDPLNVPMPEDWRVRFLYEDAATGTGTLTAGYDELRDNLPAPGTQGAPTKEAGADAHAVWFFKQKAEYLRRKYWTPALFEWWMRRFREGLPRVRRALANVPTYMLADDHEVTDDWYFSRQWRESVFTRPLGVETIRHAVMAYAVMQAWGNDPRRWSAGVERELIDVISAWTALLPAGREASATAQPWVQGRIHELLGLPFTRPPVTPPPATPPSPTFRPLVQFSYQVEGPCHRVLVVDGRTRRRFPTRISQAGGLDYEGPTGLFGDSPMAAALPEPPVGDQKLTLVVTGVPVLGPEGMEAVLLPFQRLARLLLTVDAEAWSYEPGTFEALMATLARYQSVVVLSGDIHMGCTVTLDYWSAPDNAPVRTARIVQLISSGFTQEWGAKTPVLKGNALTHDILEHSTTALDPSERIGWGTPVRTSLTPPAPVGTVVKLETGKVAHPSYRLRLKQRAPVVPTIGWPAGSTEARTPNWAWRMAMVRDQRPETTAPPNIERRWTPVELAQDPLAQASVGWHAQAARRQAYGRVFAFQTNVGIVTFEGSGANWSVRHVLAGELPPLPETGVTPSGLQPYIIHRAPLTAPSPANFATERPKLRANGAWGADETEPALQLLLHWLPLVWRWAAKHADPLWPDLPLNLDEGAKDALIAKAADRLAGTTFRRRVLRELGPFSALADAQLDATTDTQIAALKDRIGTFKVADEARALVLPDLERLMKLESATTDRAAFFDDALLVACSEWVNERSRLVSMIAGLLATFRSPLTKHVPVLGGLLGGIWDRWRNHTQADYWHEDASPLWLAGLVSLPPRAISFAVQMFLEIVVNTIQDFEPRLTGGPPMMPPELFLAAGGAVLSLKAPKRLTTVSGWESQEIPDAAGARRGDPSRETLARQTLSLLIYPDKSARFKAPAQRLSATFIPSRDTITVGNLYAAWDGKLQVDTSVRSGFRARLESASGGFVQQPWVLQVKASAIGTPGAKGTISVLRPMSVTPVDGIEMRFTPSIGIGFGFSSDTAGLKPTFELRLSLNDTEDRIAFVPKADGFLSQLLPTDGIALPIDATVSLDAQNGWRFTGLGELFRSAGDGAPPASGPPTSVSPSDKEVFVNTPQNKKLGILTLHERAFGLSYSGEGDGVTITGKLAGTLSLNVGPMRLAVSGLGVKADLHISGDPIHSDDPLDVTFDPVMPTGLAVSVNGKVLTGGGFLQRVESANGAVSWRGGMALRLTECFDIAGFGIVQTGGGQHWSLLVFLVGKFTPPISITPGLRLVSVGGMLALHRAMNTDALRDAATGTQGSLDALLLPERPEQRFLELLPAVDRFFPPAEGHHVFGPMVQLEWGAAKTKTNARIRAALLVEISTNPGDSWFARAALYGTVQMGFPKLDVDHVLRIRAALEALYDYENKFARFSLTLTEAVLFKTVHLTGGAALLIRWGDHDEWAFTLGGFHPKFRAFIPEGLREPPRLGAHWHPRALIDLDIEAYAAVTNTSIQFGASAYMVAGASWGGVRGNIAFNFLILTEPSFHFEADLSFRVTAFLFGCDLISAGLTGSIAGPGPWCLEATIYWEVCGVDISKDLGPYRWGEEDTTPAIPQEARTILGDAFADPASWSIRRSGRLPVRLRPGSDEALDARDQIEVRQARLPLGTSLEVHDRNPLADAGTWTLTPTGGLAKVADLKDVFPMKRYRANPPKDRPFQGDLACGARFGNSGWDLRRELAISSDEDATDDLILDSLPVPPKRVKVPIRVTLGDAVLVSAPTLSLERKWTRHDMLLQAAGVAP